MANDKRGLVVLAATIAVMCLAQLSVAQTGRNTNIWRWSYHRTQATATVIVNTSSGRGCGGIVQYKEKKYILTACHVVNKMRDSFDGGSTLDDVEDNITVKFTDGTTATATRIAYHKRNDIAILECKIPDTLPVFKLAESPPSFHETVEVMGYGGRAEKVEKPDGTTEEKIRLRHFSADVIFPTREEVMWLDCPMIPGDSGGMVINQKCEVVGIVSGGLVWRTTPDLKNIFLTFPGRCASWHKTKELFETLK